MGYGQEKEIEEGISTSNTRWRYERNGTAPRCRVRTQRGSRGQERYAFNAESRPGREGLEMKNKKASTFLYCSSVASIAILMAGFVGLGVRAFAPVDTAKAIFVVAAFIISAAIFLLYFMLRRSKSAPMPTANPVSLESLLLKRSLFPRGVSPDGAPCPQDNGKSIVDAERAILKTKPLGLPDQDLVEYVENGRQNS